MIIEYRLLQLLRPCLNQRALEQQLAGLKTGAAFSIWLEIHLRNYSNCIDKQMKNYCYVYIYLYMKVRFIMISEEVKLARPAQRALHHAGYTHLDQLTKTTETELSKLHGIGPKALQQLGNALAKKGLSFAKGK